MKLTKLGFILLAIILGILFYQINLLINKTYNHIIPGSSSIFKENELFYFTSDSNSKQDTLIRLQDSDYYYVYWSIKQYRMNIDDFSFTKDIPLIYDKKVRFFSPSFEDYPIDLYCNLNLKSSKKMIQFNDIDSIRLINRTNKYIYINFKGSDFVIFSDNNKIDFEFSNINNKHFTNFLILENNNKITFIFQFGKNSNLDFTHLEKKLNLN